LTKERYTERPCTRTVNSERQVAHRQNFFSVPWQRIGELLGFRITEKEPRHKGTQEAPRDNH